jgi:hypothetical protein
VPTASIFTESSKEIFPAEWYFVTKLGPQVSPFPVPIFGVNIYMDGAQVLIEVSEKKA